MLIVHLLVGLVLGFAAALWSWSEGFSLGAMLGFYVLGVHMGLVGSAAVALARSQGLMPSESLGVSQGA